MKLYNKLYQEIFFRSFDLIRKRHNIQRLKFLRYSQYWDKQQLETWQLNRLNTLLVSAKEYSPFYSDRLKNVKLPFKSLKEIQTIPILTKRDLRDNMKEILCTNVLPGNCELCKTGGSTGEPTYYYQDNKSKDWNRGSVYRSAEWAGVFLGDKTVQMTGSHYDFKEFQKLKWRFILSLQRYKDLSVAHVNDEVLDNYFHQIMSFKPTSIWGYPSAIYLFSKYIEEHYPASTFNFLKAVITSSETMKLHQRKKINEILGSGKVYDHYGAREVYIASECKEHHGYHIHAEVILLEVVDKNGVHVSNGERGRILITDLSNHAFPFIRYEIGDVGVLSDHKSCDCSITLPLLESVEGRIGDYVVLKDRTLTVPNFNNLMSDCEGVDAYQIVQNTLSQLTVKIVKNDKFNERIESFLSNALLALAGTDVNIAIDFVSDIPIPASGKRRYIISKVAQDHL